MTGAKSTKSGGSRRLRREARTVELMIRMYCAATHPPGQGARHFSPCTDCAALVAYSFERIDACRFGPAKPVCSQCTVHCYRPAMREQVRAAMRYSGPRMTFRHPYLAVRHLLDRRREPPGAGAPSQTSSPMPAKERMHAIRVVLWVVLALNVVVALAKLLYGLFSRSAAMQADGISSLFDGVSNVVALIGMSFAARPADREHPYGHAKFETFTAAVIAIMLGIACYGVARGAVTSLRGHQVTEVTVISFVIMVVTLGVNIGVTTWEARAGRRLGSEVLTADSRHTLSDVAVSIGVIISLILTKVGIAKADGVVALLVAVVIAYTAFTIIRGVARTLGDAARLPEDEVADVCLAVPGVAGCHSVRTRGSATQVAADLHVLVDPDTTVQRGHAIADQVEAALRANYPHLTDIVVHVEPAEPEDRPAS
jgi:cation diffusion facilitator family transporter